MDMLDVESVLTSHGECPYFTRRVSLCALGTQGQPNAKQSELLKPS